MPKRATTTLKYSHTADIERLEEMTWDELEKYAETAGGNFTWHLLKHWAICSPKMRDKWRDKV